MRKLGADYKAKLKRLSNKLLSAKRNALDNFLSFILQNEGKSWSEFYRFVNRRKGNRENFPLLKDGNGGLITDPVKKGKSFKQLLCLCLQLREGHPEYKRNLLGKKLSLLKLTLSGSG